VSPAATMAFTLILTSPDSQRCFRAITAGKLRCVDQITDAVCGGRESVESRSIGGSSKKEVQNGMVQPENNDSG